MRRVDTKDWVLVTGGSGFLGRHVVRRLRTQGRRVVVLGRNVRLDESTESVHFSRGDVSYLRCGLTSTEYQFAKRHVRDVVHCAAQVSFKAEDVMRSNVTGVFNITRLARDIGASSFHHVSTAYVAGKREGEILETYEPCESFRNPYEESKWFGECQARGSKVPWNVYRPAIIIGEYETGATTCWTAFYAFLRIVCGYARVSKEQLSIPLWGPELVNLCHVDLVADVICAGVGHGAHCRTYHIAPRYPMTCSDMEHALRGELKYPAPAWKGPGAENYLIEAVPEYAPYWGDRKRFVVDNALTLAQMDGIKWRDPDADSIVRTLRYAQQHKWGKIV